MDVEVSKIILKISYEVEVGYLWRKKSEMHAYSRVEMHRVGRSVYADTSLNLIQQVQFDDKVNLHQNPGAE